MHFAQSPFAQFVVGRTGRTLRVVVGLAIMAFGLLRVGGLLGYLMAAVGLVPAAAGYLDFCLIGLLFGSPFWGLEIREAAQRAPEVVGRA